MFFLSFPSFRIPEGSSTLQFLVRWRGYGHKENSWITEGDLDAPNLVQDFYPTNPTAPKRINALLFGRMGF